jgi:hypothetical protein
MKRGLEMRRIDEGVSAPSVLYLRIQRYRLKALYSRHSVGGLQRRLFQVCEWR